MHSNKSHLILASAFLLLIAAPACLADLKCYVCDNCNKVDKNTPLLDCNEGFFNQGGSTEASTVTTTTAPTTMSTDLETSTDVSPTTSIPESSTVSETSTETVENTTADTTESTEAPMPTPATVGPPETTTSVPTPPIEDLARSELTRLSPVDNSQPELPIRQRRSVINTDLSYHCYSVDKTVNNTVQTERGCSRVTAAQSVCKDLELQNNDVQLKNCDPCSMNACNSASALMQSTVLGTFLVVLVAALLQRN